MELVVCMEVVNGKRAKRVPSPPSLTSSGPNGRGWFHVQIEGRQSVGLVDGCKVEANQVGMADLEMEARCARSCRVNGWGPDTMKSN